MQERTKVSSMDLKAHMNNLRKNPKFTEEILKLVESDLQYGLTIEETEMYTSKRFDYAQMKVYSACLRNGYPEDVRDCITREGLTGEQMAVALEFYEKGVPLKTVAEVTENSGHTAFMMKKLFQNIVSKVQAAGEAVQAAGEAVQAQDDYAKDLLEQIKSVVEKIEFQEKRYDALNEKLKELQTAGQDAKIQNNLLSQLAEKDSMLEKQQNELNEARGTIARLRNEMDVIRKEKDRLEKRTEEMEKEVATSGGESKPKQENTVTDKREETKNTGQAEAKQEAPVSPTFPGIGYNVAVLDGNGKIVSFMPIERMERKKERSSVSALFSRLAFKKKIDIVKLVAEKDLEPKQLVQIRSAIEKGLNEDQLLVLINNQIPAEQMEEIINIAVYENKQKQEG